MGTVRGGAAVSLHPHGGGAAGEHALDAEYGPGAESIPVFIHIPVPGVINGEQQLCGARNIHAAEYKTGLRA